MGKDFLRLVQAAIASGALVIPGCGTAGDQPAPQPAPETRPQVSAPVVRAARLDATGLSISFSEAIRPAAGVNPDKFRLTFAYYSKGHPGDYSYYYEYYAATRGLTVYGDVGRTTLENRIEQPRATEIRIAAGPDLDVSAVCNELASLSAEHEQVGLYLHYAEPGTPRIESVAGAPLESIAPYWLTNHEASVTRGALEGRPIPVSVSCP